MTRHPNRWKFLLLGTILVAGLICLWWLTERTDREMRADLLATTRLLAEAVNIERVKGLSGTTDDLARPEYQRLKKQLAAVRAANPQYRFVYLMGRTPDGEVFFYVDSEPAGSEDESPAGQVYEEVTPDELRIFDTRSPLATGPFTNRWGTWITAQVPLSDPKTDQLIAVLGVDIDAHNWKWTVAVQAALPTTLAMLALLAITLGGSFLLSRRAQSETPPFRARYLEALLTISTGLVLTGFVAWQAQTEADRHRLRAFRHQAEPRTAALADTLHDLRDVELEGLAQFYQSSDHVSAAEFRQFTAHLTRNPAVLAWEWVPAVPASTRDDFEQAARSEGLDTFRIWQQAPDGSPTPASGRDTYFPVFRVAPEAGNEAAMGFDLGSEPVRRAAIEEALRTGLIIATEPVTLVQESGNRQGMLVFRPVFADKDRPLGLAVAVLRLESVLAVTGRDAMMNTTLLLGREDAPPEPIAFSAAHDHPESTTIVMSRPVFCFGRTFIIAAHARPTFLTMQPTQASLGVGLSGLALTLALATAISVLQRRRQLLETLVRERTAALRASEAHLSATLRSIGDGVIVCDRNGRVDSLNHVAELLTGWTTNEAGGLPLEEVYRIMHARTRTTADSPVRKILHGTFPSEPTNHITLVAKNGEQREIAQSCAPILDSTGEMTGAVLVFRDVTEDSRHREALQESDDRFRRIFTDSPDACLIIVDGVIADCNLAAEKMLRGERSRIIGTEPGMLSPEHQPDGQLSAMAAQDKISNAFQDGGATFEWQHRRLDGELFWVEVCLAATTLRGQTSLLAVWRDISRRKAAEASLLHQKAHFESLFTNTNDAMVFFDTEHRITHVNAVFSAIFGYRRDEILGRDINTVVDPQRQAHEYGSPRILRGEQIEMDTVRYTKDGRPKNVLIKGGPVRKEGQIVGGFAIYVDITSRKTAEKQLRFLGAITENMSDSMMTTDTQSAITYINKAAESLYGYAIDELLGKKPDILNAEPLAEAIQREIYATLAVGRSYQGQSLNRRKDGSTFVCEYKIFPLFDDKDQAYAYVGIQRDVTERKLAEDKLHQFATQMEMKNMELDAALARAEAATTAKNDFQANMSQEIRTPMNGRIGKTGLLLDMDLSETQRRYAEIVRSSAEALLGLVNDILDFSKIESGKLELESLDFELRPMLDTFTAMMALKAEEKGLEFICAADSDVPDRLNGDPGRLRQILTNLAGNAIKFTERGEVVVKVGLGRGTTHGERTTQDPVNGRGLTIFLHDDALTRQPGQPHDARHSTDRGRVSADADQGMVELCFSVRDTGIGIPADKIGSLFQSFTQVDASISRKFGGTGLGLAISKQLAEMMDGEIGVESTEGQGSTFWFTARIKLPDAGAAAASPPTLLRGVRALVVDDNTTNREILLARFVDWDMRADEAPDGPTALSLLHAAQNGGDPYRLAVLDIQMPGMSGQTLGQTIQADPLLRPLRTVAMTSMARQEDLRQLKTAGFAARLTKPVLHGELLDCLTMVMAEDDRNLIDHHATQEALPRFTTRKVRILLAEDNVTNQQVALGILKKLGLTADAVANGREAIEALRTLPYDLVLMDVQMPEMDGLEATRHIRSPDGGVANRRIPIIAMTAHAMQGDRNKCLQAGMNDFVPKPVSPQILAEALEKWLPMARPEDGGLNADAARPAVPQDQHGTPAVFDRAAMLERLMDDEEMVLEIISDFLLDMPRQLEALRHFLENADPAAALLQLHTIKGVAANVGAEAMRTLAARLEDTAKRGNLEAVTDRLDELDAAFATLSEAMRPDNV